MPIRKAQGADAPDLLRAWNETTELAGFCVSGMAKWTAADLESVMAHSDVLVHENSHGLVDAALAVRWRNHQEPYWDIAIVLSGRTEMSPAKLFAELGLEALRRMKAEGFTYLRMNATPVLLTTLPFLTEIGGKLTSTPMNLETGRPGEHHYRYHIDTAITALGEIVSSG